MKTRGRSSAEAALFVAVLVWSLNFTAVKVGVGVFAPLAFSIVRFSLASVVTLTVTFLREGVPRYRRQDLGLLLGASFLGVTANQAAYVGALSITSAANVALLVGSIPIWTTVIASATRQEQMRRSHWLAVGAGMAGVALIVGGGAHGGLGASNFGGDALGLLTAVTWGGYTVLIRPLMHRYSALFVSLFTMVAGTLALLPFAARDLLAQDWPSIPAGAWLLAAYTGVAGISLTNILYFTGIQRVGPSRAAIYTYLEPFLGVLFAVILLNDQVTLVQVAGGIVIGVAVAFGRSGDDLLVEPQP
jgi:drug/metabolite transporter (DMT)-like permease